MLAGLKSQNLELEVRGTRVQSNFQLHSKLEASALGVQERHMAQWCPRCVTIFPSTKLKPEITQKEL